MWTNIRSITIRALMFDRDGEFWPQLAVYLYAVGVALSVLYGIGQLLTTSSLDLG